VDQAVILAETPELPRDETGPVFREPWEAEAFAIVLRLYQNGHFTWPEWVEYLSAEIAAAKARGETDDGTRYYHHWLAALEKIVAGKGISSFGELADRKAAWEAAYLATPHGQPVLLGGGHDHHHDEHHD